MKIKVTYYLAMICIAISLSSCQTKEERVINKFENLSEYIKEGKDTFTVSDWEQILSEYEALHKEALECEFTQEQQELIGRVDGNLTAIITKEASKKLGRDVAKFFDNGKNILKVFLDGFSESISSDE